MKNKAILVVLGLFFGVVSVLAGGSHVAEASGFCTINSFYASPNSVSTGGSTTLVLSTSGCRNLVLSGGIYTNYQASYLSSLLVGPLYSSTNFSITGFDVNDVPTSASAFVTVGGNNNGNSSTCVINNFSAAPTQVSSGGNATLSWNTSGCTSVTVTGLGVNSSAYTNSMSVGPIYGTTSYVLTAYSYTNTLNQTVTVYTNDSGQQNVPPTVTTLAASSMSNTAATLNGYVSSNNSYCQYPSYTFCSTPTSYYFKYGTNQNYLLYQTPTQTVSYSATSTSALAYLNTLTPNTTYWFQLVGTNNYGTNYGGILSFTTTGSASPATVSTSVATNVSSRSARLNGMVFAPQNIGPVSVYFNYGTTPSLGSQTTAQNVSVTNLSNYFDTITTEPNTTYYYAIIAVVNGQQQAGTQASFTTPSEESDVSPTIITRVISSGTGGGSKSASLTITSMPQFLTPGNAVNYLVTYQNTSSETLSNVTLTVMLPKGVAFQQTSQGMNTTDNIVVVPLTMLSPNQQGTVSISGTANSANVANTNFVATATLAFTSPAQGQDSAVAYAMNNVGGNSSSSSNNLAGAALFGTSFFPTTLLGWILLIIILLIIAFITREFYTRGNTAKNTSVPPTTIVHYDTPPQQPPHY